MTLKSQSKTAFFTFPASAEPRRKKRRENSTALNASLALLSARSPYPKMRIQPRSWLSFMTAYCRFTCQNAPCRSQKQSKSKCSNTLTLTASVRKIPCVSPQCGATSLVAVTVQHHTLSLYRAIAMSDEIHFYIQLQQQIHQALRVQHPDWVEPNGNCPTCDSYESRLAELLGLSPRMNSAIPSDAASEAIREIAWESDRRFA